VNETLNTNNGEKPKKESAELKKFLKEMREKVNNYIKSEKEE
jgi:hypothetical protein